MTTDEETDEAIDAVGRLAHKAERWAEGDSNREAVPDVHEDRDYAIRHIREAAAAAKHRRDEAIASMARDDAARALIDVIATPAGRDFASAWDHACFLFGRTDAPATLFAQREAAAVERERERCARIADAEGRRLMRMSELPDSNAVVGATLDTCAGVAHRIEDAIRRPAPGEGSQRCETCGSEAWFESLPPRCMGCGKTAPGEVKP